MKRVVMAHSNDAQHGVSEQAFEALGKLYAAAYNEMSVRPTLSLTPDLSDVSP